MRACVRACVCVCVCVCVLVINRDSRLSYFVCRAVAAAAEQKVGSDGALAGIMALLDNLSVTQRQQLADALQAPHH